MNNQTLFGKNKLIVIKVGMHGLFLWLPVQLIAAKIFGLIQL